MGMSLAVLLSPCLVDAVEGGPDSQEVQRDAFLQTGLRRLVGECVGRLVSLHPGMPRHPLKGSGDAHVSQSVELVPHFQVAAG